jgi:hypothetical protein
MTGITKLTKALILFLAVFAIFSIVGIDIANACGWGQGGGQGYVPQRRDQNGYLAQKQALTQEQAKDIVTNAEVIDEGNEVIQLVGVDKQSGRLIVLN